MAKKPGPPSTNSTTLRRATKFVTGIHIVRKNLARGVRYYVYAWRGGPQIHAVDHVYPQITPSILAKQQRAIAKHYQTNEDVVRIDNLISLYEESPGYKGLAESTRKEYSRHLNRISEHFGKTPLAAFEDTRMRGKITTWKNQWEDKPRTADMAAMMMNILLGYGVEMGMLQNNVAARIKTIHKVDRSDLIWEEEHWKRFYDAEPPKHIVDVVELASLTGLRLGDIVQLTWGNVGQNAIIVERTNKRKTRAVIPIIPALKAWLDARTDREGHICKNSRGFPWTADGFESSYKTKLDKHNIGRHFHDLRGTYATKLILRGLTDDQVAMIMAWKAKNIAEIRARYVNEERVILDLVQKLGGS